MLVDQPRLQRRQVGFGRRIDDLDDEAGVRCIEREVRFHRPGVADETEPIALKRGVHVQAFGEATTEGHERVSHCENRPPLVVGFVALGDPVERDVATRVGGLHGRVGNRDASLAQCLRCNPATTGEGPRPVHRAGVEVIVFVPAVVLALAADVGFDHRDQRPADAHVVGHVVHDLLVRAARFVLAHDIPRSRKPQRTVADSISA